MAINRRQQNERA